jgi:hypothetical protein
MKARAPKAPTASEKQWWKKYFYQYCDTQGIKPDKDLTEFLWRRASPKLAARLAVELIDMPQAKWKQAARGLLDSWENAAASPERKPSPWKQAEAIQGKEDLRELAASTDPDA